MSLSELPNVQYISIALTRSSYEDIRKLARKQKMAPEALAEIWVGERLGMELLGPKR